ncbi:EF-P lysine aminoacylase EpmA [Pseudoxanthobacter sp.]|uniref:EF-P lysine aminoacylase EpmA n=1 Tax=Pseudoxanthobacter sp. TaxID=1925742 RepID=UPI002FE1E9C9
MTDPVTDLVSAPAASPFWQADVLADRLPRLAARGRITAALRSYFAAGDFVEAETPVLQVSPGNEVHLHAFATTLIDNDGTPSRLYLHTSPEFTAKKLLAGGVPRLFTLARVFRNRERTDLHHPEFTLLEWYRAREDYGVLVEDCAGLLRIAADAAGAESLRFRGRSADPRAGVERVTVVEAFRDLAGIDLPASLADADRPDRTVLAAQARAAGIRIADDDTWADIFTRVMVEKIEPRLGHGRPTALMDYPASEAALARRKPSDPRLSERFELYACGVELANGFGELTDAAEQRRRFEADMAEKQRLYGERHPIDADFLAALAAMPPASGIALGVDRLVMLLTGATRITDVLWAPVARHGTAL